MMLVFALVQLELLRNTYPTVKWSELKGVGGWRGLEKVSKVCVCGCVFIACWVLGVWILGMIQYDPVWSGME
jgi:hypothetical protein